MSLSWVMFISELCQPTIVVSMNSFCLYVMFFVLCTTIALTLVLGIFILPGLTLQNIKPCTYVFVSDKLRGISAMRILATTSVKLQIFFKGANLNILHKIFERYNHCSDQRVEEDQNILLANIKQSLSMRVVEGTEVRGMKMSPICTQTTVLHYTVLYPIQHKVLHHKTATSSGPAKIIVDGPNIQRLKSYVEVIRPLMDPLGQTNYLFIYPWGGLQLRTWTTG